MRRTKETPLRLLVVTILLALGVFTSDLLLPLGVAASIPYVVVVFIALRLQRRQDTLLVAVGCSVLTILGSFYPPPGGELWKVLVNRVLTLFAIWVVALFSLQRKRAQEALQKAHDALTTQVAERTAHLTAMRTVAEIGRAITASLEPQTVLDLIVEQACSLVHTERSALAVLEAEESEAVIRFVAQHGLSPAFPQSVRPRHERDGTMALALAEHRPVWSADLLNDPAFDLAPALRAVVEAEGYRAVLAVPLVAGNDVLGALAVYRDTAGSFTPNEVEILQVFAGQAAVALQNARLFKEARQRADRLTQANAALQREMVERQRLEEYLRQSQKMEAIGTLAGGVAHDFNNILAAILGYSELALTEVPQTSPARRFLREVLRAGTRARDLVRQILTFSRQTEQARRPLRLHLVVKESLALLRASLPATITIQQHFTQEDDTVLADPTQMHQVLMNLCTNAEHAMRETGGVLEVRLEIMEVDAQLASRIPGVKPASYVRLTVRDTGTGMTAEVRERIFEPYFTTKAVGEGTGMGLAVVHGIVTSHGGTIKVESVRGQGTTFAIYLPRLEEAATNETPEDIPIPRGSGCILFVDDEAALARLGQELLERLGYEVIVRTSSVETLEVFRAAPHRFALVITDQTMPNMTGEALARELRHIRPDIPILLCTGFSHTMTLEKAQALGIDAFLMKPLLERDLALAIKQVLEQRAAHARPPPDAFQAPGPTRNR